MVWSWPWPSHTPTSPPENNSLVHYDGHEQSIENSPALAPFPGGIKVLHDCADATVDICFVHGLTGNRESTWTAHGQSEPWPRTLLPSGKLSNARILTFGYDAYVVRRSVAGKNRLIDHATNLVNDLTTDRASEDASSRPLIFVAHSLGGLVCKQALLHSRNNAEAHLRSIFECTKGIIFMGTPHGGSAMATWAAILAKYLGVFKSTNEMLLKILEPDNQLLEAIHNDFLSMIRALDQSAKPIKVTCFYEELPLYKEHKVVSKNSATFAGYNQCSIHANHLNMVKFASREDPGFKKLKGELMMWKDKIEEDADRHQQQQRKAKHRQDSTNTSFHRNYGFPPHYYAPGGVQNYNSGNIQNNASGNAYQANGSTFNGDMHFGWR